MGKGRVTFLVLVIDFSSALIFFVPKKFKVILFNSLTIFTAVFIEIVKKAPNQLINQHSLKQDVKNLNLIFN